MSWLGWTLPDNGAHRPIPGFGTIAVHAGHRSDPQTGAIVPPISLATTFEQRSPGVPMGEFEYSRSGNPTRAAFEQAVAKLEGGLYGVAFASGSAASMTLVGLLSQGAHILSVNDVYGGTSRYFGKLCPNVGIAIDMVDMMDPNNASKYLKPQTKMVWIETPTNPTLRLVDIKAVSEVVKKYSKDILVIVDNTFLSPCSQRPLDFGADIVLHSVTKYINGHCDVIMGAVITNNPAIHQRLLFLQNAAGAVPSPFDCYLALRGLKTLHLRIERHNKNAMMVAQFLESQEQVEAVYYPGLPSHKQHDLAKKQQYGFGGMVSMRLRGDLARACLFVKSTRIFMLAESLGGIESLLELPAIMTHGAVNAQERQALGITDTFIRLSVGIEDGYDLVEDLRQALQVAYSNPKLSLSL